MKLLRRSLSHGTLTVVEVAGVRQSLTIVQFCSGWIINIVDIVTRDEERAGPDNETSCRDYFNILDHKLAIEPIEPIDITDVQTNDAENNNR